MPRYLLVFLLVLSGAAVMAAGRSDPHREPHRPSPSATPSLPAPTDTPAPLFSSNPEDAAPAFDLQAVVTPTAQPCAVCVGETPTPGPCWSELHGVGPCGPTPYPTPDPYP
jgi:hypothetical protein